MAKEPRFREELAEVRDFASEPVYQTALQLCALVLEMESHFPDDEKDVIYAGMRLATVKAGALVAAGFGRTPGPSREDLWERARSSLMEARHYALLANMRYLLDAKALASFEAVYYEALNRIGALLGFPVEAPADGRSEGD
jgi:hypothetical protein